MLYEVDHCGCAVGSMTYAMKAQRALNAAAIYAKIVKYDGVEGHPGCSYGVRFPCGQAEAARAILRAAHIPCELRGRAEQAARTSVRGAQRNGRRENDR